MTIFHSLLSINVASDECIINSSLSYQRCQCSLWWNFFSRIVNISVVNVVSNKTIFQVALVISVVTLREKCPNAEFFLVRIFLYSIYSVHLRIQSEYRNIPTRKNPVFGHFSRSASEVNDKIIFDVVFKISVIGVVSDYHFWSRSLDNVFL